MYFFFQPGRSKIDDYAEPECNGAEPRLTLSDLLWLPVVLIGIFVLYPIMLIFLLLIWPIWSELLQPLFFSGSGNEKL